MSRITLKNLRHSYVPEPGTPDDWALKELNVEWSDGGAYALLGPSGCGKTTLLNIISGLIRPTEGRVFFDDADVTDAQPGERNIAQVFQFPVVYDTMTVRQNLEFPLRNRGVSEAEIPNRVKEIASILDLDDMLPRRAAGLTADGKQKISLGRGLVRSDVNAILFDEPLTVIDPHLKWQLRSKLKELHQRIKVTMIYVTHDQIEALTFANTVVVMHEGTVVQIGTPVELFERPQHTFVGHFIGSPGMNVLPCSLVNGAPHVAGQPVEVQTKASPKANGQRLEIGVRPEYVRFADSGVPAKIVKVSDVGRYRVVETRCAEERVNVIVKDEISLPADGAHLQFEPAFTGLYADGWRVD